jgi:hypothetical protein
MQVRCSNWKHCPQKREFGEFTCIHYPGHEPVPLSVNDTCATVDTMCLYYTGRCLPVETEHSESSIGVAEPVTA